MVRMLMRTTGAALGVVLLGGWLLLGAPAHADGRTDGGTDGGTDAAGAAAVEDACDDVDLAVLDLPATCVDGTWVSTDDGFGDAFGGELDDGQDTVMTLAIVGFVVVAALGIGGVVWRARAARRMARRAGMDEGDAVDVALLGTNGIEAAYLASAFRPQDRSREAGTARTAGEPDAATRLAELQRLRDQGLITDEEHAAQRRRVIEGI